MLNVREATPKQILDNNEITCLCKIIGLNFKEKYTSKESMKTLRYGKIMIMTDQDHDGSHIKGLIINFIHYQWPNLLKHGFLEEFITPIIKVSKNKKSHDNNNERSFYSMPEFEEWQKETADWHTWKLKYYKGLGTSTSKEAKEYFSNMNRHCISFEYSGIRDDLSIQLAFNKCLVDERKDWLTKYMESRRELAIEGRTNSSYLYQKDTKKINYNQFINKELVLFSNLDNERSIPSIVDGFKPGQRKVLFACFKRNLVKELKVAQLAGSVAELSAYHHGEASLMGTIINLAQNYIGSNNLNLLMPIGQFGTRLHGGRDSASPRYIFTCMNPLTRLLFNAKDDPLFDYLNDDGQRVEPEFYCPIIPLVLVNGAEGIGTGWSSKIPNFSINDIIDNLKRIIRNEDPVPMKPFYKNFRGEIEKISDLVFVVHGEIALIEDYTDNKNDYTIEITELPVGVWTQNYKESVLEPFLTGENAKESNNSKDKDDYKKVNTPLINDFKEYHTDCTGNLILNFNLII
jgi:DNA topoisomerase II